MCLPVKITRTSRTNSPNDGIERVGCRSRYLIGCGAGLDASSWLVGVMPMTCCIRDVRSIIRSTVTDKVEVIT